MLGPSKYLIQVFVGWIIIGMKKLLLLFDDLLDLLRELVLFFNNLISNKNTILLLLFNLLEYLPLQLWFFQTVYFILLLLDDLKHFFVAFLGGCQSVFEKLSFLLLAPQSLLESPFFFRKNKVIRLHFFGYRWLLGHFIL